MSSELAKIYRFQPQQDLAGGFKRLISRPGRAVSNKANAAPSADNNFVTWGLGGIGVAALLTAAVVGIINLTKPSGSAITAQANQRIQEYQSVLEREPNNANALINLATTFIENEKYSDAIPLMEKLVALEPGNLDLRFQLASLFELTGNKAKEEEVYDQLLVQQPDNLKALLRKATLRGLQGDAQTAQKLFAQAEKVAPTSDLKGRVREVAQTVLKPGGSSQN
jgi:tetratricopeptide (TPR) repeat protein